MKEKTINWRRQQVIFIGLLLGIFILAGLLAVRYDRQWDLTANQRNELTAPSVALLQQLDDTVAVTAFVRGNPKVKRLIQRSIAKYQRYANLSLTYQNPDLSPDVVREHGIERDGELLLRYHDKTAVAKALSESAISQAIQQLLENKRRHVVFLTGQGERPVGAMATGYSQLLKQLDAANIQVTARDLKKQSPIPDDVDLLVLAAPQLAYAEAEQQQIIAYLHQGGRLLWLTEPQSATLPLLVSELGVMSEQALLSNSSAKAYGLRGDNLIAITPRNALPVFHGVDTLLVFSRMTYLKTLPTQAREKWLLTPMLAIDDNTVVQRGKDLSMAALPLDVGVLLTPKTAEQTAQVMMIADADFLSNQFIGLGQNSEFAMNIFEQLTAKRLGFSTFERPLPSPVVLSEAQLSRQIVLFVVVLPLLILLLGFWIRRRLCSA